MGVKRNFVVILSKNEVVMMKKIIATRSVSYTHLTLPTILLV